MVDREAHHTTAGRVLLVVFILLVITLGVITVYLAIEHRADQEPAVAWALIGASLISLVGALLCFGVIGGLRARAGKWLIDLLRPQRPGRHTDRLNQSEPHDPPPSKKSNRQRPKRDDELDGDGEN